MDRTVVVVESPAKARTLKKFLGKGAEVFASYGHVRDLVPKGGAVAPDDNFAMRYEPIERNEKHVSAIAKALKQADRLVLATDPDREGEAISWHLHQILQDRGLLKGKAVQRVVFHEITERAIRDAMEHPRDLADDLIDAQQARRALDYLVGFNLSPLLWKKIRPGLSAGRVQSPALRLIVEREEEIEAFEAREFWRIEAALKTGQHEFGARLYQYQGHKTDQFEFTDEASAHGARDAIEKAANGTLVVTAIERKARKRNPAPPFITSTLQQEASRKLGFTTRRTMQVAQSLYEGVDLGDGPVGLITYMRTDSTNLAPEALEEMRTYIDERFGTDNLPPKARLYRTKSKNAQEAHEAIRPTSVRREPKTVAEHLTREQARLYELIWNRAVACQMIHATLDQVAVDLAAGDVAVFRATGSTIRHAGFMQLYMEDRDEGGDEDDRNENKLPALKEQGKVPLSAVNASQHFTEPPPRYTEASLVKTLEAHGIGRPSTYASIIQTLLAREYAELENRHFLPSDVGRIVNRFLTQYFERYVDYDFTAKLEDKLDAVSRGERDWKRLLKEFWSPFEKDVEKVDGSVTRRDVMQARVLGTDPKSGREVSARMGRYGPFVQIGTVEEEEKPRFASLRPGQKLEAIELDEALYLFRLPRELGETPEGEKVTVNIGRFGPYVRYDSKYASIKEDDPYTIELDRALEIVRDKKEADAKRLIRDFDGVRILNGRYGPFITDGTKNARVPKEREPESLTLDECKELLAKAPARKKRTSKKRATRRSKKS
ncbi:MAG: DNA topoisomerase I [Gammaproteobacteria bacterium]